MQKYTFLFVVMFLTMILMAAPTCEPSSKWCKVLQSVPSTNGLVPTTSGGSVVWAAGGGGGGGGNVVGTNYQILNGVFYLKNLESGCWNRIDTEGSNDVVHFVISNCLAE
jgi:hypothetical protein